jgi:DNA repair exonuclease SbcCD ATPase subunit
LSGGLLDNVAPFLNEKAAYYSKYLTKGNIEISFQTQRELSSGDAKDEFRVVANNVYGAEDYAGGSGGEQQKIDVCVALALQALGASRVHSSVNIGLFDEIFESLDDASVDCVMDLLQEETKTRSSTFVITHLASLKAMFPSRILVVKEDGISTIVDGAS